jgi:hypothetical protein
MMQRAHQGLGLITLVMGLGAMGLTGCDDDPNEQGTGTGELRVVHASPGAPAVDLYLAGSSTPFATNLAYGESTPYVELQSGTYSIDVRAAGASPTVAALYTSPAVRVDTDRRYTAVAAGDVASTDQEDSFRVLPFTESFGTPGTDAARVRIVHASTDAPTVNLNVGNDGGTPEIQNLERFKATDASGLDLPADSQVQIGVESGGQTLTAFTTPELEVGSDVFIIATGLVSALPRQSTGFSLLTVGQDSVSNFVRQNPTLYAFHGSPDAGPVDIFSGDTEVADSLDFGELARVQVAPGRYTLDFYPAQPGPSTRPTSAPAASTETPNLVAGQSYLAIAAGELMVAAPTFRVIVVAEQFALDDPNNARVRAIHASSDAPAIDLGVVQTPGEMEQPPLITDLSFGESTEAEGVSVPPAETLLGLAPTGDTETVAEFAVAPAANERAFVIAAGSLAGGQNPLGLFVVDTTTTPWTVTALPPE